MTAIDLSAFLDELTKIAEELSTDRNAGVRSLVDEAGERPSPEPQKPVHPGLLVGAGLAGLVTGYAGGHLATHGLNKLLKRPDGTGGIPSGVLRYAPAVAGLTGLGVGALNAYTWDKARKAMAEREAQSVGQGT